MQCSVMEWNVMYFNVFQPPSATWDTCSYSLTLLLNGCGPRGACRIMNSLVLVDLNVSGLNVGGSCARSSLCKN